MGVENDNDNPTISDPDQLNQPSFGDDEDNNPFSHQGGITSFMGSHHQNNNGDGDNDNDGDDLDDESLLLYNSHPNANANGESSNAVKESFNEVQINHESRVSKLLKPNNNDKVEITEAGNSNEGMVNASKKYVVYTIKLINLDVPKEEVLTRRRYSDFESLRDILTKIFPLIIIPPIPPKNYFNLTVLNGLVGQASSQNGNSSTNGTSSSSDNHPAYSYINSTHLTKNKLIEHRKRLLANFLNNCLKLNRIRTLQFFAKFLDPNANWTDEITLITSQLPKSIYMSNPENGLKTDPIYINLPNPSNGNTISFFKDNRKKLTKKTTKLLNGSSSSNNNNNNTDSPSTTSNGTDNSPEHSQTTNGSTSTSIEKHTNAHYIMNTSDLDLINKKIMANYMGLSNDYAELGTIFNSFSLILSESSREGKNKDESKANVIFDKIGQAFDRSYITINVLIGDLETKFSEPLGEAVQYTGILQFITKFQNRKIKQKELLDSELKAKRKELEELLHVEDESSRIDQAVTSDVVAKNSKYNLEDATSKSKSPSPTKSTSTSTSSSSYTKFKLFPSMNSIKKITQYVSEIIDQNPEQTRKQRILVLQEKIKTFEKCQTIMLEDISYISDEVNKDFEAFHKEQLKMIYEILLCYNRFLIGWAKKNIEIWEEIKEEVSKL
ncbi:hypothetical protein DFJ63DRAFT_333072 [Scheffersomyces coipomensis]|uniref:uncharacterized protein n=1 Tax=Scheffersomyces coipomensis TaxID=1788519 RepID=UPI00315C87D9